ncbi:FixG Ig-like domain-containing protein, partial [Klebsiella pneumoniae]|uniref:FixG Ig-like domain-containing protein n=1 Tax=Klebsiella pneumoniae TaxID=573 RepID=UPI001954842C
LNHRSFTDVSVLHERNPLFVRLSDGAVRNAYTVRILNKRAQARLFVLAVDDLPIATRVSAIGSLPTEGSWPLLEV